MVGYFCQTSCLQCKTYISEGFNRIEVSDNGLGFTPERLPKDRLGISTSIKARMELIGGEAQVLSEPGAGTTVMLRWAK